MKIVIIGAGAIGTLFGAFLSRGGHEIILTEKKAAVVEAINRAGIGVMEPGTEDVGTTSYIQAKAVSDAAEIKACDLIILAVKSFDTRTAVESIAHLAGTHTPVLSLQTGLGNLEIMEEILGAPQVIGGYTLMAATALGAGRVRQGGLGRTYIGELDGRDSTRCQQLHALFNDCNLPTKLVNDIVERIWEKVIVFAAIHSVSAILRIKNGALLEHEISIGLLQRLIDEGRTVAMACGIKPVGGDLYELLYKVCRQTAANLSPMLQDILNNHRTDIDALSGILCRYGEMHGVEVRTHRTMTELIKLLEVWQQD